MKIVTKWFVFCSLVFSAAVLTGCSSKMGAYYDGSLLQRRCYQHQAQQCQPVQYVACQPVQTVQSVQRVTTYVEQCQLVQQVACVPVQRVPQEPYDDNYRYEEHSYGVQRNGGYSSFSYGWGRNTSSGRSGWNSQNMPVWTPNPPGQGLNTQCR